MSERLKYTTQAAFANTSRLFWNALMSRVATWMYSRLPAQQLGSRQRAMRVFEEAAELIQSEGVSLELALRQVEHVYGRPAGDAQQEVGGIMICVLGWCHSTKNELQELTLRELLRIEARSPSDVQQSLDRKAKEGLLL